MRSRLLGGILLIVGTSIGGGMLALPVANAPIGFWSSSLFLLLCWFIMTVGAFFILEVNLYLPRGRHMVSMSAKTLGVPGLVVTWLCYLLLLYVLLAAYISGGADMLGVVFRQLHRAIPDWIMTLIFTCFFGLISFAGIRSVDFFNRGLMLAKLSIYAVLVVCVFPYIHAEHLQGGQIRLIAGSIMILLTSFGFAIIVPNLRDYFNDDIVTLKKVIFIGSLVPLVCYVAWDFVIMGAIPSTGASGLIALREDAHTTSQLAHVLSLRVNNMLISALFNIFLNVCMLTAFLGVSLCLTSFLADGLKMERHGRQGGLLFLLTFLPPTALVLYYPGAYLTALNYAGSLCVILLMLLPALMSIYGRQRFQNGFVVPGGSLMQWVTVFCSIGLLILQWF